MVRTTKQAGKTAAKSTNSKKRGPKRKQDDKEPDAHQDGPGLEEEEDEEGDQVIIEEDPYETKEELEALEELMGSDDLVKETVTGSREPAACLGLPLLPYQKEFLAWGIDQELSNIRGGILADEMGMGKTLQAVSLIVTHPREGQILGPDSSPAAAAAAVVAPAPKMKLRLPSSLKRDEHADSNAAPSADAADAEAATGAEQATKSQSQQDPASPQGPATQKSDVETKAASTPGKAGTKKKQPAKEAAAEGKQEGSASPESKSGKTGKAAPKEKKKKVDPLVAAMQQAKKCYAEPEDNGTDNFCGATLVICPVVAALQWQQEIIRYTGAGTLNVVVYHGTKRSDNFTQDQLEAADVVLTSYSTIEADFRRNVMAPKATCKFCGKKFQPERLKVHLRYFCGPYAQKTEAQARQQKKRAPWLVGGDGGGAGDGKKGKTKGSDGAGTSKGLKTAAETEEMLDDDEEDEDTDSGSESEKEEPKGKKPTSKAKKRPATKKAVSTKGKAKGKTKAATGKVSKKDAPVEESKTASKGSKGASTSKPQGKVSRNRKAAPPASKKRKLENDAAADPPGNDSDGEDDDMQPSIAEDEAAPVHNKKAISTKGGKASKKPEQHSTTPPVAAPGKMTRARASKAAAPVVYDADGDTEMSDDEMEEILAGGVNEAPAQQEKVGLKRKRNASSAAGASRKPAARAGSKAKGAAKKKKTVHTISDSDEDSDWDPDSDDEQQQQADAVESSDEGSVVDEAAEAEEEEDDVVEVEEEEDVLAEPESKKAKKERRDREEAELDRLVNEAASKMIAAAMKERAGMPEGRSILHDIRWRRVILDEAHSIKNRVTELYSLIRFLRLHPFAHYFADKTKCCSLDFPFKNDVRKCDLCQGSRMSHYCWWNRRVANPIKYQGYEGRGRIAMLILKHQILPKVLLRRTKVQRSADLALPPRTVVLRKDPFDAQEADFYEALYTQSQAAFGGYVESGTILNNYAHIFDLLIRLRQAVNHPYLVVYSASGNKSAPAAALEASNPDNNASEPEGENGKAKEQMLGICGICHDPLEDGIGAECGHAFCRICVSEYMASVEGAVTCPTCRRPLCIDLRAPATSRYNEPTGSPGKENVAASTSEASSTVMTKFKKQSILNRINISSFQSSTKLEALREEIHNMLLHDPSAKCIVFSQFTSMLDLVQYRLSQVGIRVVKLEGSMSMEARQKTIKQFNEDPNVPCFLMSLKAGGVALNLTVASHVMLMDPWWNPAVEQQAQDRIHRLGQFKPITVTRFVIAGTIEERILKLQDKKQLVFEGTVGRDSEALGKLTVDDLRFLFG